MDRIPFTDADEAMIRSLAGWMTFMAIVHIVGGALGLVGGSCLLFGGAMATLRVGALGAVLMALVVVVLAMCAALIWQGTLLLGAKQSFKEVANTDEADQEHLSRAFERLRTFFLVEMVIGGFALLGALLGVVNLVVAGRGAS